ncbi:MAG TPA: hypothetical protein VIP28_14620 [Nocardioides sp.]
MRSEGIRGSYVGATSGIPLPAAAPMGTPGVGLVSCARCDLRTRPGAFHICLEPVAPRMEKPQVGKKPPPDERTARHEKRAVLPKARRCKCGKKLSSRVKQCRACHNATFEKPACGTIEGYNWHRRQAAKNPTDQPWPLPKADPCGCRAARAEYTRQRRDADEASP